MSLLAAIAAAPDDDGPRLVYADWLTSRGDPRGEFIIVQVELAKLGVVTVSDIAESDTLTDADVVRGGALLRRQYELLGEHGLIWIDSTFGDIDFYPRVRFVRGFVSRVTLSRAEDARGMTQLFKSAAPGIDVLCLVKGAAQDDVVIDALVTNGSSFANLRELFIHAPARSTLTGAAVESLIRLSPKLETIGQKECSFPLAPLLEASCVSSVLTSLNVEGLTPEMMMRVPCMRHVKVLNLKAYGERGPEFLDVSICPHLEDVTMERFGYHPSAHLVSDRISLDFVTRDAFKNREPLPALRTLRLEDNSRTAGNAVGELLDSKIGSTLTGIEVDGLGITHAAVEAIAAARSITKIHFGGVRLRTLAPFALRERGPSLQKFCIDSVYSDVNASSLESFLTRNPGLRVLSFGGVGGACPVYEGKLVDALAAHAPASLRSLRLHNWDLTDDDRVSALVQSPALAKLRRLQLYYCAVGDGGARAVSNAPMPQLVEINLNLNGIRGRGIRAFANATQKFPGLVALCLGGSGDIDSYTHVLRSLGPVLSYKDSIKTDSGTPMSSWRDAKLEIVLPYLTNTKHLTPEEIATHLNEDAAVKDLFRLITLATTTETTVEATLDDVRRSTDGGDDVDGDDDAEYEEPTASHVVPPFTLQMKCDVSGGTHTITIWYRLSDRHAIRPALERIARHLMSITGQGTDVRDNVLSCEGGIGEGWR